MSCDMKTGIPEGNANDRPNYDVTWTIKIIVSLYTGQSLCCQCGTGRHPLPLECLVKYLHTSYSTGSNLCWPLVEDHSSQDLPGAAPQKRRLLFGWRDIWSPGQIDAPISALDVSALLW